MKFKFELEQNVITKYKQIRGHIIARTEHVDGHASYLIKYPTPDGKSFAEGHWNEDQIEPDTEAR